MVDESYPTDALPRALQDTYLNRGISQREAAEQIGVTQQTFSRWRHGQLIPAPSSIPAIARFLGLPVKEVRAMHAAARREKNQQLRGIESRLENVEEFTRRLDAQMATLVRLLDAQGVQAPRPAPRKRS